MKKMKTKKKNSDDEQKKYVSHLGFDYTEFIKTEEQIKDFEKMCEHEKNTHKPVRECIHDVVAALNLDRKLRGKKQNVFIQAGPKYN